jgi:hypothetical protein
LNKELKPLVQANCVSPTIESSVNVPEQRLFQLDFVGVAGAAQVEGGNVNSDCWLAEHVPGTPFAEVSGVRAITITATRRISP